MHAQVVPADLGSVSATYAVTSPRTSAVRTHTRKPAAHSFTNGCCSGWSTHQSDVQSLPCRKQVCHQICAGAPATACSCTTSACQLLLCLQVRGFEPARLREGWQALLPRAAACTVRVHWRATLSDTLCVLVASLQAELEMRLLQERLPCIVQRCRLPH
jgi:hypothetical protein